MLSLIEALNYRCLRDIRVPLDRFHVMVGPNGSGKSTLLDTIAFLGSFTGEGLESCLLERSDTENFEDLFWQRSGNGFQLAIEAVIPGEFLAVPAQEKGLGSIRYELEIGRTERERPIGVLSESLLLKQADVASHFEQRRLFPELREPRTSILTTRSARQQRTVFRRQANGQVNFYPESYRAPGKGFGTVWRFAPDVSAFGNLPEDADKFPAALWLRAFLENGSARIELDDQVLGHMSPPIAGGADLSVFGADGSAFPRLVQLMHQKQPVQFQRWQEHCALALPGLNSVEVREREDIRHLYLEVTYSSGLRVPSWGLSQGTLRFLALSLIPYLPETKLLLIEEPEIGLHPGIVAHLADGLSSAYASQILVTSHSPVLLSAVPLKSVLCFAQNSDGSTDIVRGTDHPRLANWMNETPLGDMFAAGVLS